MLAGTTGGARGRHLEPHDGAENALLVEPFMLDILTLPRQARENRGNVELKLFPAGQYDLLRPRQGSDGCYHQQR